MAREELDREDLMREATALRQRLALEWCGACPAGEPSHVSSCREVVIGFRNDGSGSVYFEQDPVFQFNRAGELRRAFRDGRLYKSERGRLVRLTRMRTTACVTLLRHDLTDEEQCEFLEFARQCLVALDADWRAGRRRVRAMVSDREGLESQAQQWLNRVSGAPRVAQTPRSSGTAPSR